MTKFLNESGFRRIIKTIKNALSLKADKSELPLLVTYTGNKADYTYDEIKAAFDAGRVVEVKYTSSSGLMVGRYRLVSSTIGVLMFTEVGGGNKELGKLSLSNATGWSFATTDLQEKLVSGTTIKTVAGNSLLGSGDVTLEAFDIQTEGGVSVQEWMDDNEYEIDKRRATIEYESKATMDADGSQPNGTIGYDQNKEEWYIFDRPNGEWRRIDNEELNQITSITTTESTASGGNNTVTINTTNGTSKTFNVKNGQDGADGVSLGEVALVQTTGDSEESVMSQKAVTEYGRKVTAEDLNGTSSLVVNQMTDAGVDINKRTLNSYVYTENGYCVTKIPVEYGHFYTIYYKDAPNRRLCGYRFLNENGVSVKDAWYNGTTDSLNVFAGNTSYKELQVTFSMPNLKDSYIWDVTSNTYVFRGDSFIASLCSGLLVDATMLRNEIITQELGQNETLAVSQKTITEKLKGNQGWTFTTNHYWGRTMDVSRSEYAYNLSEKPIIDVVSFNIYSGNAPTNGFFFFSPILASSYGLQDDFIGFTYSVWKIIFVVRRGGTTLLSQDVWSNDNSTSGSISGFRLDFRRKIIIIKKRECQTGIIDTVEIDLSGYDLDLGKSFLYTGFGGPNPSMGVYIGYNSYQYLDFDGYFHLPVKLGSPKPVEDNALVSNYYGDSFGGFSGFANITATKVADNHYSIALDSSSYVLFGANYLPIQELGNGITMQNGNSEWVFKIKATGAEIMMKSGAYVTFRDAWNLTDNEEFVANNGEYTLADGKEYEIRLRYQVNANIRWFMQLKGTATVELYDCRIYGIMNTWIIPLNYDGYRIKGSIPFLYSYPEKALIIPTIDYSNNNSKSYVSGQLRVNTNNNIYMNVFDQSTMKFIEKQINNS